jgi:MOSC domain-containing protein YiiM
VDRSTGRLVAVFVAPRAGAPMEARACVGAVAGAGLEGDRYRLGVGTWSGTGRGRRDVTLVEREVLAAVRAAGVDLHEDATRRNLVTEGVSLDGLVGHEFRIGDVRMRGVRPAEPCAHLEQLTRLPGVFAALRNRGGLRAEILDDGDLHVGDPITVL